jgi:hypothetical protein
MQLLLVKLMYATERVQDCKKNSDSQHDKANQLVK